MEDIKRATRQLVAFKNNYRLDDIELDKEVQHIMDFDCRTDEERYMYVRNKWDKLKDLAETFEELTHKYYYDEDEERQ